VAGDQIVIPFRQYFITVGGAVKIPGRYPYVPDRDWTYYVGLAGGVDVDRNSGNERRVVDLSGKTRAPGSALQPEDSIILASNSFLYGLGQTSAILSTTVSIITLVLTVYKLAFPSTVP
jgi:protein involved in polysaccharide export with SLBB domain